MIPKSLYFSSFTLFVPLFVINNSLITSTMLYDHFLSIFFNFSIMVDKIRPQTRPKSYNWKPKEPQKPLFCKFVNSINFAKLSHIAWID